MIRPSLEAEQRADEIRKQRVNNTIHYLDVPEGVRRDGFVYHWASDNINGVENGRPEELSAQGYEPVPAARLKHKMHNPLSRNRFEDKFIIKKGVTLMEIPKVIADEKIARDNQLNNMKAQAMNWVQDVSDDEDGMVKAVRHNNNHIQQF